MGEWILPGGVWWTPNFKSIKFHRRPKITGTIRQTSTLSENDIATIGHGWTACKDTDSWMVWFLIPFTKAHIPHGPVTRRLNSQGWVWEILHRSHMMIRSDGNTRQQRWQSIIGTGVQTRQCHRAWLFPVSLSPDCQFDTRWGSIIGGMTLPKQECTRKRVWVFILSPNYPRVVKDPASTILYLRRVLGQRPPPVHTFSPLLFPVPCESKMDRPKHFPVCMFGNFWPVHTQLPNIFVFGLRMIWVWERKWRKT